jgi:NitT/TauT family transport system substrate-binding protein
MVSVKKARTLFVILLCLSWFCSACGTKDESAASPQKQAKTFHVATLTWVGYAPIYLAQEKGFFEGIDVQLEKIEDTPSRRAALASGNVQGSVDILDSFTNGAAAGLPASVVLKLDDSMGGDGIVVRKSIQSIRDLRGKTVAYPPGLPSHFFLLSLLDDVGMKISEVESRPLEADQAGAAFVSGSVDAAVTWEPWLSKAAAMPDGKILTTSRDKPGLIVDVFTVRNDFLRDNPDVVSAFLRGWFRAVDYWQASPKDATPIMAKAMGLSEPEFAQMVAGVRYSDLANNQAFFTAANGAPSPFAATVERANKIWGREGLIRAPVDPMKIDASAIVLALKP